MTIKNSTLKCMSLSIFLILFCFSCIEQSLMSGDGTLKGKISIGPLCPVETDPPLPGCLPTAETYKAWATAVWTLNRKSKVTSLNPKLDGTYEINIPVGSYIIDFVANHYPGVGGNNLPAIVTVSVGDTTKFNINIDTGIR